MHTKRKETLWFCVCILQARVQTFTLDVIGKEFISSPYWPLCFTSTKLQLYVWGVPRHIPPQWNQNTYSYTMIFFGSLSHRQSHWVETKYFSRAKGRSMKPNGALLYWTEDFWFMYSQYFSKSIKLSWHYKANIITIKIHIVSCTTLLPSLKIWVRKEICN